MCKQVYLVGPSATSVSHVQRGAHRHLVCMRDESCAVSARSCRHQVLLRLHASSGHPGQHAPRRDPQSSGGGSEAARRRPGGRGAAASVSRESSLGHGKKGGFRKGPESAFKELIPDYLIFFVFFCRLPGFHRICTRLPGVPSQGGQITWFSQNLHQITWSPKSGGTRLPGPLLAIKWTRLPGKTRLPGGAKRGPEYLVSTKKRPDYLGAANWVDQSTWVSPSRLQGDG